LDPRVISGCFCSLLAGLLVIARARNSRTVLETTEPA
jgi:hypothetical protein